MKATPRTIEMTDSLLFEHNLQLFARIHLSEGNPFKQVIEDQTTENIEEIMGILGERSSQTFADRLNRCR